MQRTLLVTILRLTLQTLLSISLLLPSYSFAALQVAQGIPNGFEQMNTPRPTSVTLYYGGELLGNFAAHFTPGTLQFDHPEEVANAIATLKDKTKIMSELSHALPANAQLLCGSRHPEGCGRFTPEVIGVIFDENSFVAELFINKNYLSVTPLADSHFLPLPPKALSSVYAFSGAVNGSDGQLPNFTLSNQAVYSYGESKLSTQSTLTNKGVRFDTAEASTEKMGWSESAGLFRSHPLELLTDRDMAGVSVSTSSRTWLDQYKTQGNDIIVYLPRQAFVSIYREGRLYSSHAYEAGNQQIDTTELPDGAYTITLRIQEADGTTREEKRFFAKNEGIPAANAPIYYAQAGLIRKPAGEDSTAPQFTSDPIVRMGTVRRVSDNIGLSASVLGVKDRAVVETGVFWIKGETQLHATTLTSSKGDAGIQASLIQNSGNLNLSLDARKLWMNHTPLPGYEDMSDAIAQAVATASYQATPNIAVGLRGSYSQQDNSPTAASAGPYAEWRIWQHGESMLTLNMDAARTNGRNQGSILFHFSHRFGEYGVSGTTGAGLGNGGTGPTAEAHIWHDDPTPGNALRVSSGFAADKHHQSIDGSADWHNRYGEINGSAQETIGSTGAGLNYGGNFAFNAAQLGKEIHVGGNQNDTSAIIIDTQGDTVTPLKVFVNGTLKNTINTGEQQVIYLPPFHTYNVRLVPEKNALLDYDSNDKKVILYPGNVAKLSWNINSFYVVSARILKADGTPLANALLQESRAQITTDEKGYIQAELSHLQTLSFTMDKGAMCSVHLPNDVKPEHGILLYTQSLSCE